MKLIALLLFIMIVLTLMNGIIFFKKLIKLQQENNNLMRNILEKINPNNNGDENKTAMPSADLEKLKAEYMKNRQY